MNSTILSQPRLWITYPPECCTKIIKDEIISNLELAGVRYIPNALTESGIKHDGFVLPEGPAGVIAYRCISKLCHQSHGISPKAGHMHSFDLYTGDGKFVKTVILPARTEAVVHHTIVYIWSDAWKRYIAATTSYEPEAHKDWVEGQGDCPNG